MRARLILSGIPDPLRQLPDMHALLDVAEAMITEHMDSKQLDKYRVEMYRPGLDEDVVPAGFDQQSQMAAFQSFAKMAADED